MIITKRDQFFMDSLVYLGDYGHNAGYLAFARIGSIAYKTQYGADKWCLSAHNKAPSEMADRQGLYVLDKNPEHPLRHVFTNSPLLRWGMQRFAGGYGWIPLPKRMASLLSLKVFPLIPVIPCS